MVETTIALKKVLGISETFASYTGGIVDSLHLLIALTTVKGTFGCEILSRLGFEDEQAKKYLIKTDILPQPAVLGVSAIKILDYAKLVAKNEGYEYCDTQHLLLSISFHKTEIGGKILEKNGIEYTKILSIVHGMAYNGIGKSEAEKGEPEEESGSVNIEAETEECVFGTDLTDKARRGKLDKVFGREKETDRLIRILSRRNKNNPMIIGEPGVGKTAIVEGLAIRIVEKKVPDFLLSKRIIGVDINGLVAGTRYRGEMEEKVRDLIESASDGKTILFFDEMHTVLTAGGGDSGLNVASVMKPALSRGDISVIGATTVEEYRKYVETDPAFERRFNVLDVEEMDVNATKNVLMGLKSKLEKHHGVTIDEGAIEASVRLSDRYIIDRYLPDKAIDLIDEACSKKRNVGIARADQTVTKGDIQQLIMEWKGIPLDLLTSDETIRLKEMEKVLSMRVIGQEEAIHSISKAIRRSRSGLGDPTRPIGSFLFIGPTGVGKTETAKALAEFLFGSEKALLRFDMSEYMDKNSSAKLIGAPPGYVGYEKGGTLTDAIRRRPYSVVLFDEIEKADPEVTNVLLQLLDDGRLTDGRGRTVDCKNIVVIMTGNIGTNEATTKKVGFSAQEGEKEEREEEQERRMAAIKKTMSPEFINRIDSIIIFSKINKENQKRIADILVEKIKEQLLTERQIVLTVEDEVIRYLAEESFDQEYGARPLKRKVETDLEDILSDAIIENNLQNTAVRVRMYQGKPKIIITGG